MGEASELTMARFALGAYTRDAQVRRLATAPIGDGWTRKGRIVVRVWAGDIAPRELALLRVGSARRLARPDALIGPLARPHFVLSDQQEREAERRLDRECLHRIDIPNLATTLGRTGMQNLMLGTASYAGPSYFAVGNGTLPAGGVAVSDTQCVSEQYRQALTLTAISGNTVDFETTFGTGVGNFVYTEAGLFGSAPGNTASATANSGAMWAHAAYAYASKTSSVTLTNDWYISLS